VAFYESKLFIAVPRLAAELAKGDPERYQLWFEHTI
jgi:hypothetical protein